MTLGAIVVHASPVRLFMFLLRRSSLALKNCIPDAQRNEPLSYPCAGMTRGVQPPGFPRDHNEERFLVDWDRTTDEMRFEILPTLALGTGWLASAHRTSGCSSAASATRRSRRCVRGWTWVGE